MVGSLCVFFSVEFVNDPAVKNGYRKETNTNRYGVCTQYQLDIKRVKVSSEELSVHLGSSRERRSGNRVLAWSDPS